MFGFRKKEGDENQRDHVDQSILDSIRSKLSHVSHTSDDSSLTHPSNSMKKDAVNQSSSLDEDEDVDFGSIESNKNLVSKPATSEPKVSTSEDEDDDWEDDEGENESDDDEDEVDDWEDDEDENESDDDEDEVDASASSKHEVKASSPSTMNGAVNTNSGADDYDYQDDDMPNSKAKLPHLANDDEKDEDDDWEDDEDENEVKTSSSTLQQKNPSYNPSSLDSNIDSLGLTKKIGNTLTAGILGATQGRSLVMDKNPLQIPDSVKVQIFNIFSAMAEKEVKKWIIENLPSMIESFTREEVSAIIREAIKENKEG